MPTICPDSDFYDKYNEISDFCNEHNEPVFITKNDMKDLVVLSIAEYEQMVGKQGVCRNIAEALAEAKKQAESPNSEGPNHNDTWGENEG